MSQSLEEKTIDTIDARLSEGDRGAAEKELRRYADIATTGKYTLRTLRAMYVGSRSPLTLRAALLVFATIPQGNRDVSGRVVGLGSKIAIQTFPGGELVEDIHPAWVTHAEVVSG